MTLAAFDLNATRLLGVSGPATGPPRVLPLDGAHVDLPLVLSLQGRHPEVGRAGVALCRLLPHLTCQDFLSQVGKKREWVAGRHRLDANKALSLTLEHLQPVCANMDGLALVVPVYLGRSQMEQVGGILEKIRGRHRATFPPLVGSASTPLAVGWAAHAKQPATGLAIVADIDDHALTWTALLISEHQVSVLGEQIQPNLNLRVWKERLLDAVAERCVRQCRRDPRDSSQAEQGIYQQLEGALEAWRKGQPIELVIQSDKWYQNLVVRPEEVAGYCASLVRLGAEGLHTLLTSTAEHDPVRVLLMTETAGSLPGLAVATESQAGKLTPPTILPADAAARAAHDLAGRMYRGQMPFAHHDVTLSFQPGQTPEIGNPPPAHKVIPMWRKAADR